MIPGHAFLKHCVLNNTDGRFKPGVVKLLENVQHQLVDGSIVREVADTDVFMEAIFTKESMDKFHIGLEDSFSSPPELEKAQLVLQQYSVKFQPSHLSNYKEHRFILEVNQFGLLGLHEGFGPDKQPKDIMEDKEVLAKVNTLLSNPHNKIVGLTSQLVDDSTQNTETPQLSLSTLIQELGEPSLSHHTINTQNTQDCSEMPICHEKKGTADSSGNQGDKILMYDRAEALRRVCILDVEDFIISPSQQEALDSIPEWKSDYTAPAGELLPPSQQSLSDGLGTSSSDPVDSMLHRSTLKAGNPVLPQASSIEGEEPLPGTRSETTSRTAVSGEDKKNSPQPSLAEAEQPLPGTKQKTNVNSGARAPSDPHSPAPKGNHCLGREALDVEPAAGSEREKGLAVSTEECQGGERSRETSAVSVHSAAGHNDEDDSSYNLSEASNSENCRPFHPDVSFTISSSSPVEEICESILDSEVSTSGNSVRNMTSPFVDPRFSSQGFLPSDMHTHDLVPDFSPDSVTLDSNQPASEAAGKTSHTQRKANGEDDQVKERQKETGGPKHTADTSDPKEKDDQDCSGRSTVFQSTQKSTAHEDGSVSLCFDLSPIDRSASASDKGCISAMENKEEERLRLMSVQEGFDTDSTSDVIYSEEESATGKGRNPESAGRGEQSSAQKADDGDREGSEGSKRRGRTLVKFSGSEDSDKSASMDSLDRELLQQASKPAGRQGQESQAEVSQVISSGTSVVPDSCQEMDVVIVSSSGGSAGSEEESRQESQQCSQPMSGGRQDTKRAAVASEKRAGCSAEVSPGAPFVTCEENGNGQVQNRKQMASPNPPSKRSPHLPVAIPGDSLSEEEDLSVLQSAKRKRSSVRSRDSEPQEKRSRQSSSNKASGGRTQQQSILRQQTLTFLRRTDRSQGTSGGKQRQGKSVSHTVETEIVSHHKQRQGTPERATRHRPLQNKQEMRSRQAEIPELSFSEGEGSQGEFRSPQTRRLRESRSPQTRRQRESRLPQTTPQKESRSPQKESRSPQITAQTESRSPQRRPQSQKESRSPQTRQREFSSPQTTPQRESRSPQTRPQSQRESRLPQRESRSQTRSQRESGSPQTRPQRESRSQTRPQRELGSPQTKPQRQRESRSPQTRPQRESRSPETRPQREVGSPRTRPQREAGSPRTRPQREAGSPQTRPRPGREAGSPQTRPQREAGSPPTRPRPRREAGSHKTTPQKESRSLQTRPQREFKSPQTVPQREPKSAETDSQRRPQREVLAHQTTHRGESRSPQTRPQRECRSPQTKPQKEASSPLQRQQRETGPLPQSSEQESASPQPVRQTRSSSRVSDTNRQKRKLDQQPFPVRSQESSLSDRRKEGLRSQRPQGQIVSKGKPSTSGAVCDAPQEMGSSVPSTTASRDLPARTSSASNMERGRHSRSPVHEQSRSRLPSEDEARSLSSSTRETRSTQQNAQRNCSRPAGAETGSSDPEEVRMDVQEERNDLHSQIRRNLTSYLEQRSRSRDPRQIRLRLLKLNETLLSKVEGCLRSPYP